MEIIDLKTPAEIAEAAALAAAEHARLNNRLPRLPPRNAPHYAPMLEWMSKEGDLLGVREDGGLVAFLGGFILDDFRNAGKGALCPDWCHGAAGAAAGEESRAVARATLAYRILYRELASRWVDRGVRIHAACAYDGDSAALEALSLTGFGRIVLDAAVGAAELAAGLAESAAGLAESAAGLAGGAADFSAPPTAGLTIRRAGRDDSAALAELNARLAAHIGAAPVLMPRTHGSTAEEWTAWFDGPAAVAFLAERAGRAVAYIRAEEPQFDVSHAVHGERTLAINGLFTEVGERRSGTATLLLQALAAEAVERGMELVSVDCETTNIEAYAFWSRRFHPVTWSFERRV